MQAEVLIKETIAQKQAEWRKTDERIIVATGRYDFMHPGSLRFLRDTRKFGSKLLVIVWDELTALQYHNLKPINTQDQRMHFLSHFRFVDYVMAGSATTFNATIALLHPYIVVAMRDDPLEPLISNACIASEIPSLVLDRLDNRFSSDYAPLFRRALQC